MNIPTTHKTCERCGILHTISHFAGESGNDHAEYHDPVCRTCRSIERRIALERDLCIRLADAVRKTPCATKNAAIAAILREVHGLTASI